MKMTMRVSERLSSDKLRQGKGLEVAMFRVAFVAILVDQELHGKLLERLMGISKLDSINQSIPPSFEPLNNSEMEI